MAVLWFAGTVLLDARPAAPKYGWFTFGLMLAGSLMVEAMQWSGRADVLYTSYPPLKAHLPFYTRDHFLRGRSTRRRRTILRHADHCQAREDVDRVDTARGVRRDDGGDHRREVGVLR